MARTKLSPTQRRLLRELDQIVVLLRLNYREVRDYAPEERLPRLKVVRDQLIRSEIVMAYTFVDESLNAILCNHFFGRKSSHMKLWKTKRFKNFNYFFLEKLSLLEKLAYVHAIRKVPRSIRRNVDQLNALRNGIAHAFFPENLRSAKPKWKGLDVFSLGGARQLVEDLADMDDYFTRRAFGV